MRRGRGSLPCLAVGSLDHALDHYERVLGFEVVARSQEPEGHATVRLDRAELLLREGEPRRTEPHGWDAVLFVSDVRRAARLMRERGADVVTGIGLTELSRETLEVRDRWGNLLAVARSERGLRPAVRRAQRAALPVRARVAARDLRHQREEREHRDELVAFRRALPGRDPFFMYFTRGLLHWVRAAAALVPPSVDLALIGSDLPEDECAWLGERLGRPFHPIRLAVDDNTTWEWLFAADAGNFGWLDIDCFVLAPELFGEMAAIGDDVAVNAIWAYDSGAGFPIACTHFAFLNAEAIRAVQRDSGIGPANYDWDGSNWHYLHERTHCRVPTRRQRRTLASVLPPDGRGRPAIPGDSQFFDTLVAFQVAARACGYRTRQVRPLEHRTQATLDASRDGDRRTWQQDLSNEVVHVGGISYHRRWFHTRDLRAMYLAADQTILEQGLAELPAAYAQRAARGREELARLGLDAGRAAAMLRRHLVEERGLAPAAVERILGAPARAPR